MFLPWKDALEVVYTPDRGRYVIANRDIDVGECLIHEKAIVNVGKFQNSLDHCYFCLRDATMNPLPCHKCSAVVFCSAECRIEAASWYGLENLSNILKPIKKCYITNFHFCVNI